MTRRIAAALFGGALVLGTVTRELDAQSCTANSAICSTSIGATPIDVSIGAILKMTLAPLSTTLTTPTPAIYNTGFAANTGPTLTIKSNKAWTLGINALTATWGAVDTQTEPARTNKPAGDLLWATAAGGPFTPLTNSPVQVTAGAATASTNATLYYRTLYAWQLDTPGSYSLQIVFTITAP